MCQLVRPDSRWKLLNPFAQIERDASERSSNLRFNLPRSAVTDRALPICFCRASSLPCNRRLLWVGSLISAEHCLMQFRCFFSSCGQGPLLFLSRPLPSPGGPSRNALQQPRLIHPPLIPFLFTSGLYPLCFPRSLLPLPLPTWPHVTPSPSVPSPQATPSVPVPSPQATPSPCTPPPSPLPTCCDSLPNLDDFGFL